MNGIEEIFHIDIRTYTKEYAESVIAVQDEKKEIFIIENAIYKDKKFDSKNSYLNSKKEFEEEMGLYLLMLINNILSMPFRTIREDVNDEMVFIKLEVGKVVDAKRDPLIFEDIFVDIYIDKKTGKVFKFSSELAKALKKTWHMEKGTKIFVNNNLFIKKIDLWHVVINSVS